jgi:DNA-binding IclR family transcriptional regulator
VATLEVGTPRARLTRKAADALEAQAKEAQKQISGR